MSSSDDVTASARATGDHPIVEKGARLGYAASGLIHLLIGWIAFTLAWNLDGGSDDADQSGALAAVANTSTGPLLLGAAAAGFALLALWQLTEIIVGRNGSGVGDRLKSAGKALLYATLAFSAFRFVQRAGSSSEESTQSLTAELLGVPGGRVLVALIGLAVVAGAGYHVYKGWTCGFLKDLDEHPGRFLEISGRLGYIAKGIALLVVGGLFISAGVSSRASDAGGLDAALKLLLEQPFGPYAVTVAALGLAGYGIYSFGRARHAKL